MKYLLIACCITLFFSCTNTPKKDYYFYEGPIQGTTFHITYEWSEDLAPQIDSLLQEFNMSLSNYDPNSNISQINMNLTDQMNDLTRTMLESSYFVYENTDGAFDVTVAPIVNAWGFGWIRKENQTLPDSLMIDSLLQYVGMDKIMLNGNLITKDNPNVSIITNAIAQGLSVDYVSEYLIDLGLENFLVEIGGEIYCYGKNSKGEPWRIGIDKPIEGSVEENRENQIIINLSGRAIATSGNYRKFIENDNEKIGHSIDPRTGYYAENDLLSVSVIGDNCMMCDAFATGFMVCGQTQALQITEKVDNIEAYFLYLNDDGAVKSVWTNGFEEYFSN